MKTKRSRIFWGGVLACTMIFSLPGYQALAESPEPRSVESIREVPGDSMTYAANSWHNGAEIEKAFDGNRNTFWDAAWEDGDTGLNVTPIEVEVEFDSPKDIAQFVYTPRQDDNPNGQILKYSLLADTESGKEVALVENGTWANDHKDKTVEISQEERLKSVKLSVTQSSFQSGTSATAATAAEFTFYEKVLEAKISQESMALTTGEQGKLSLTDITGTEITWTSSDSDVADVSQDGTVTGKSEGAATITGETERGETASCEVSVSEVSAPEKDGYVLVFEDNFDGESLDMTKWNNWCVDLKEEGLFRYANNQNIAVHPDNAYVKDGTLRLLASKEETTFDGQMSEYRAGMVQTRDKYEFQYGYMETMIKIPDVGGTNPAIWMMPQADDENGGWLWGDKDNFGAEIDILERPHPDGGNPGMENKYQITMHYDNYAFTNHTKYHAEPTLNDPYKWHKFAIEWDPDYIKFIVDGEVKAIQENDVPNTPEIFILSIGMGGWIGTIDDTGLPVEMEVDYVRWYQNISNIDSTVSLDRSEITVEEGAQEQLASVITPEGADKVIKWESSDTGVATVDENGLVTGVKEGMAYITALTQKNQSATCKVTVTPAKTDEPDVTPDPDETPDPDVTPDPDETPDQDVTPDPDKTGDVTPDDNKSDGAAQTTGKSEAENTGAKAVKTGDASDIWLFAAAAAISGSVFTGYAVRKKRNRR